MLIRALLIFDVLVTLVILNFFVEGLGDGSVSADNAELWAVILAALAGILGFGLLLSKKGQRAAAIVTLLLLAVPGGLYAFFIALVVIFQPRWN
jgi:hypothetical protein